MTSILKEAATKVPALTLGFWIIKILATTIGETGGDTVSMSWLGETTPNAGASGLNGYFRVDCGHPAAIGPPSRLGTARVKTIAVSSGGPGNVRNN